MAHTAALQAGCRAKSRRCLLQALSCASRTAPLRGEARELLLSPPTAQTAVASAAAGICSREKGATRTLVAMNMAVIMIRPGSNSSEVWRRKKRLWYRMAVA